jgi:3-hydroxyacyl-CoA dehydrogenase/enoyl-CoA hydratase/3-hydroxybutyryl-CoA epimerase
MAMLAEGMAPALIENAARMAGMPVGPLAVSDEVTIDLQWKVMQQEAQDLGAKYRPPPAHEVVRVMVEELKRPGRRFGGGFYEYPAHAPKHLWPGLSERFPVKATQPAVEEVKKRFLYIQALESARCVEEGVVTHPADADLGSILGWGFPAWTGGTLSFIDTVGVGAFVDECKRLARAHGPRFRPSRWLAERARKGTAFLY